MQRNVRASLMAIAMAVGCGTDVDLGERPQFNDGTNALTVLAYNAVTGAAIDGASMTMTIGDIDIAATRKGNAYTFTNVPTGDFLVVASAAGFFDFHGVTDSTKMTGGTLAEPARITQTLALYPLTPTTSDLTIKVFDSSKGLAVVGGRVVVTQGLPTGLKFSTTLTDQLTGSHGYHPQVQVFDLADGVAVMEKAKLVYGAEYSIQVVDAQNTKGEALSHTAVTYKVESDFPQVTVLMDAITTKPIIMSHSLEGDGKEKAAVDMKINFDRPVSLCNLATQHDYHTITSSNTTDVVATEDDTTFTVSADGLSLQLKPKYGTVDTAADFKVKFIIANIKVTPQGVDNCQALSALCFRDTKDACTKLGADDLELLVAKKVNP